MPAIHDGTYGTPGITAELPAIHAAVNHGRRPGRCAVSACKGCGRTIANRAAVKAPGLIGRDFTAAQMNQRHVGNITNLPVGEQAFLHLAAAIDLHSRRPAGWAIADHMGTAIVVDVLDAVQCIPDSLHGTVMHNDHGT